MHTNWKEYFAFSRKDRNAAIIIIGLILFIIVAVFFYTPLNNQSSVTITTLEQELANRGGDTTAAEQIAYVPSEENEVTNASTVTLFPFDPNTLDAAGFKRLGLQDKTIHTIFNYRSKGGHFWKADDLRKIYGLKKEDADRLIPYVQIAGQQATAKTNNEHQQTNFTTTKPAVIDINTATAEQWKTLPAIGDVLANRIVKFRDKIGGFTSVAQVKQTYGLSDSAFHAIGPYLTLTSATQTNNTTASPKITATEEKVNINTASLNQLKSNPHIPQEIAQAIVIYRSKHGNFTSIDDVKKIVFINEELFRQIAPYLTVE